MTTLVLDAQTGISGDMTVAALLDLGANFQKLQSVLESLPDQQFEITVSRVRKNTLDACDFKVTLQNSEDHSDHDMDYLFGKKEHSQQEANHGHNAKHHFEHRHLKDIFKILDQSCATEEAKLIAKRIFTIVANAEAQAHGVPVEEVHFHEVGALDSIVDILSVAVLIDDLCVDEVIVPTIGEGYGEIRCQHGILPIPVPAVLHIVQAYRLTLSRIDCRGEFITPTGAAIIAALKTTDKLPEHYKILKSGLGAGKRTYKRESLLRASLIEAARHEDGHDEVVELKTNIDDSTAEMLGFTLERLYENGALEAWFTPVFMKKNRPAYVLSVLCKPDRQEILENIIFNNTTSIGIRSQCYSRRILTRRLQTVQTQYGPVQVKACEVPDENGVVHIRHYPEYESVKTLALEKHIPVTELYRLAQNSAENV